MPYGHPQAVSHSLSILHTATTRRFEYVVCSTTEWLIGRWGVSTPRGLVRSDRHLRVRAVRTAVLQCRRALALLARRRKRTPLVHFDTVHFPFVLAFGVLTLAPRSPSLVGGPALLLEFHRGKLHTPAFGANALLGAQLPAFVISLARPCVILCRERWRRRRRRRRRRVFAAFVFRWRSAGRGPHSRAQHILRRKGPIFRPAGEALVGKGCVLPWVSAGVGVLSRRRVDDARKHHRHSLGVQERQQPAATVQIHARHLPSSSREKQAPHGIRRAKQGGHTDCRLSSDGSVPRRQRRGRHWRL